MPSFSVGGASTNDSCIVTHTPRVSVHTEHFDKSLCAFGYTMAIQASFALARSMKTHQIGLVRSHHRNLVTFGSAISSARCKVRNFCVDISAAEDEFRQLVGDMRPCHSMLMIRSPR